MGTKKRPDLGAVIFMYICGLGLLILFGPSAYFYTVKYTTEGTVVTINTLTIEVSYFDQEGEEYIATTKGVYKRGSLELGDKVKVYYLKGRPTNVHLPDFDGYQPYLLYYVFLLLGLSAVLLIHRDYIRYK